MRLLARGLVAVVLLAFTLVVIIPFIWMIVLSLRTTGGILNDPYGLPIFDPCRDRDPDIPVPHGKGSFMGGIRVPQIQLQTGIVVLTPKPAGSPCSPGAKPPEHGFEEV